MNKRSVVMLAGAILLVDNVGAANESPSENTHNGLSAGAVVRLVADMSLQTSRLLIAVNVRKNLVCVE